MRKYCWLVGLCLWYFMLLPIEAVGGTLIYGDEDVLGTGTYPTDPTVGAMLQGLAPGAHTFGAPAVGHGYPFSPSVGEFAGTDQIYVGSVQSGAHDGYSTSAGRQNGPQVINLDYSSLVSAGQTVQTFTLGIAADDFQFPSFGNPFTAQINGSTDTALSTLLNSIDQSGPVVQFLTFGISTAALLPSNVLTLSIDEGGDGGDGWAIDFLTVGVTAVPEPTSLLPALVGTSAIAFSIWRRKKSAGRSKTKTPYVSD
jgi:hypothetical protein